MSPSWITVVIFLHRKMKKVYFFGFLLFKYTECFFLTGTPINVLSVRLHSKFHQKNSKCQGRMATPKQMNFWRSSKGGGVIFNPKIYVADLDLYIGLYQNENDTKGSV